MNRNTQASFFALFINGVDRTFEVEGPFESDSGAADALLEKAGRVRQVMTAKMAEASEWNPAQEARIEFRVVMFEPDDDTLYLIGRLSDEWDDYFDQDGVDFEYANLPDRTRIEKEIRGRLA